MNPRTNDRLGCLPGTDLTNSMLSKQERLEVKVARCPRRTCLLYGFWKVWHSSVLCNREQKWGSA